MEEEPFFQTAPPHVPLRRVRSTLLVASLKMVRDMGRADDYFASMPAQSRAAIADVVAGTWIDVDLMMTHYRACEALGLSDHAQIDIGRTVGVQIRSTLAGAIAIMAKESGVTPWTVLAAFPRFWPRFFDGSAILGWKLGPKEVRIDAIGMPLADVRYFRNALRGQCMGVVDLFCTRSYANPRGTYFDPGTYSLRVQWA